MHGKSETIGLYRGGFRNSRRGGGNRSTIVRKARMKFLDAAPTSFG